MSSDWEIIGAPAHDFNSTLLAEERARLIFTDPPFGTGKVQQMGSAKYTDHEQHDLVLAGIRSSLQYLAVDGTLAVLCDYRLAYDLVPYIVNSGMVLRGEVIWEFGLGRPRTSWWPNRHNHVLTFTWGEDGGIFDASAVPRERRLAPKRGYPDDRPAGSVWQYTMSNTDPQRVSYPNQKGIELIQPFIKAHTLPGDIVLDPFAGSSSTGEAALRLGRRYVGVDSSVDAVRVSTQRLTGLESA